MHRKTSLFLLRNRIWAPWSNRRITGMKEKPVLEKLFLEHFFSHEEHFKLKNWRSHKNDSYNKIQQSIAKNIDAILNSTNSLKIEDYLKKKLTFKEFGVPDFLTLYQTSNIGYDKIEKCVHHALQFFEPRLLDLTVKVESSGLKPVILIKGRINKKENSFFEIIYHNLK